MSARKTQIIKKRLGNSMKSNRQIPQWKFQTPGFAQRWNMKKRNWKAKKLNIR